MRTCSIQPIIIQGYTPMLRQLYSRMRKCAPANMDPQRPAWRPCACDWESIYAPRLYQQVREHGSTCMNELSTCRYAQTIEMTYSLAYSYPKRLISCFHVTLLTLHAASLSMHLHEQTKACVHKLKRSRSLTRLTNQRTELSQHFLHHTHACT